MENFWISTYFFRSYGGIFFHFGVTVEFSVILPMVLQIHNTIVLQGAELEGRDGYL
jgi:hypothetical protein